MTPSFHFHTIFSYAKSPFLGDLCVTLIYLKTPRLPGWSFQQRIHGGVLPPPHSPRQARGCGFPPLIRYEKTASLHQSLQKNPSSFWGCAVGIVTRVEKPQRNEKLERFCAEGILVHMLRSVIVKRSLQQSFSGRSRWLLHNLGSKVSLGGYCWKRGVVRMIHYQAWKSDQVWCFFFFQGLNMEINTVIMRTAH